MLDIYPSTDIKYKPLLVSVTTKWEMKKLHGLCHVRQLCLELLRGSILLELFSSKIHRFLPSHCLVIHFQEIVRRCEDSLLICCSHWPINGESRGIDGGCHLLLHPPFDHRCSFPGGLGPPRSGVVCPCPTTSAGAVCPCRTIL